MDATSKKFKKKIHIKQVSYIIVESRLELGQATNKKCWIKKTGSKILPNNQTDR